jgi:hypothetical protein
MTAQRCGLWFPVVSGTCRQAYQAGAMPQGAVQRGRPTSPLDTRDRSGATVCRTPGTVAGEAHACLSGETRPARPRKPPAAAVAGRMRRASPCLTDGTRVQR